MTSPEDKNPPARKDRRRDIVEAAFDCLRDGGHAALTARKIAARSDISLGNITYHFKTMDDVLEETYRFASARLAAATRDALDLTFERPEDELAAFLEAGFRPGILELDYIKVRIDLWAAALHRPGVADLERELYDRYRDALAAIIGRIAAARGVDHGPVPMLTDTIMAALDGLWLDWERRQDNDAIRRGLDGCLTLVDACLKRR